MSDHLPECIGLQHSYSVPYCVCHALRACEQRVREEWYEAQSEAWEQGYFYAIDAARDAVAALSEQWVCQDTVRDALAAIDALRQPSPRPPAAAYDPTAKDNRP